MTARRTLMPPSPEERDKARVAAVALRRALTFPKTMGAMSVAHLDLARPRRGEWWTTWENLPGFTRICRSSGLIYHHALLPGWDYTRAEIVSEMIPDLERLAEHGKHPVEATR